MVFQRIIEEGIRIQSPKYEDKRDKELQIGEDKEKYMNFDSLEMKHAKANMTGPKNVKDRLFVFA